MDQADFPVGSYVRHVNMPGWGMGKVLGIGESGKRRVFFEYAGERLMTGAFLTPEATPQRHALFARMDARTDLHCSRGFLELEDAFLKAFPQGFADPAYLADERAYKMDAVRAMAESCSRQALSELLERGDHAEVCERAKRILAKTNLVFPNEKMALNDGLKRGEEQQRLFATRLFNLLYGEEGTAGERFESFVAALEELGALKWTIATYFPFLAQPDARSFVKPSYAQEAARAYAFDLGYSPHPSWRGYERVTRFVRYVDEALRRPDARPGLTPRDYIDVQGFIWCTLHGALARG